MLYKEWKTVRLKLITVGSFYLVLTGLVLLNYWKVRAEFRPLWQDWLELNLTVLPLAGALGGMDIVAEEKDSGTIGFLLARPLSRWWVYTSKLGLNLAAMVAPFVILSPVVWLLDQLGTKRFEPLNGLSMSLAVLLIGVAVTCLSGIISIFARNTIHSLVWSLLLVGGAIVGFFTLDAQARWQFWQNPPSFGWSLSLAGVMAALAAGLFWAGLHFFTHKEF